MMRNGDKRVVNIFLFEEHKLPHCLGRLIEQIINDNDTRVNVLCSDEVEVAKLDKMLWTFSSLKFVPHATFHDPYPEEQPVLIVSSVSQNMNNGTCLIMFLQQEDDNKVALEDYSSYSRLCFIKVISKTDAYEEFLSINSVSDIFAASWDKVSANADIFTIYQDSMEKWHKIAIK